MHLLPPQWIITPKPFKLVGGGFQALTVVKRIVALEEGLFFVWRIGHRRQFGREDFELRIDVKESTEGFERHTGGIGLAIGRVASDMGCTYIASLEKREGDMWLVLPYIDDALPDLPMMQSPQQCGSVSSLTSRGVDEVGFPRE
jgi:hypothetical protein